jgi:hypothetical protein
VLPSSAARRADSDQGGSVAVFAVMRCCVFVSVLWVDKMSIDDELLFLLLEEEEDDDDLLLLYANSKRKATDSFFKSRQREGCYKTLIKNHLISDDVKFREYCRLNNCSSSESEKFILLLSIYTIVTLT